MKLYLQYGEELSEQWKSLCEIELKPLLNVNSRPFAEAQNVLGIHFVPVRLPNGEVLNVDITYSTENRGISIRILSKDTTLIQVGGFKRQEISYDPNVIFITPNGIYVSAMVGA
ncbi:hypothetical protein [Nostoc sp. CHAB 5715]|uniref:hypothetical protein n=1 Tax=Nostoc sp. CHAB 5715 TaxID=2780400 RepID=UPI001E43BD99|nr:hypothetical protein [Nostoc sp. CHAB 5715]MCC5621107.1 hypothetical protein [Nostoc sp. CHAB 5715]